MTKSHTIGILHTMSADNFEKHLEDLKRFQGLTLEQTETVVNNARKAFEAMYKGAGQRCIVEITEYDPSSHPLNFDDGSTGTRQSDNGDRSVKYTVKITMNPVDAVRSTLPKADRKRELELENRMGALRRHISYKFDTNNPNSGHVDVSLRGEMDWNSYISGNYSER